jgi:hypothetical protein
MLRKYGKDLNNVLDKIEQTKLTDDYRTMRNTNKTDPTPIDSENSNYEKLDGIKRISNDINI